MIEPKIGELWIHKQHGYTCVVLGVSEIMGFGYTRPTEPIRLVEIIRTKDQYKMSEPIGMFTWHYEKLS
jgi:hypothetical protein